MVGASFEKFVRALKRHGQRCKNLKCRQTAALIGSALVQFSVGTVTSLGMLLLNPLTTMAPLGSAVTGLKALLGLKA